MVAIAVVIILALLFGVAEILDWVGRLEIVERKWPKVHAAMNSRLARLIALLFLIALIGHDIEKHTEIPEPPRVTIPAPPVPQFTSTKQDVTRTLPAPKPEERCWLSNHFGMPNSTIKGAMTASAAIIHCNHKVDAPYLVQVEFDRDFIPGAGIPLDSGVTMMGGVGKRGRIYTEQVNSPAFLSDQIFVVTVYGDTDQYPRALRASVQAMK